MTASRSLGMRTAARSCRAELDAYFFRLYGIDDRDDVDYILETFQTETGGLKHNDIAKYGTYRTKDLVLDVYDRMVAADAAGRAYETEIKPSPGQGHRHPGSEKIIGQGTPLTVRTGAPVQGMEPMPDSSGAHQVTRRELLDIRERQWRRCLRGVSLVAEAEIPEARRTQVALALGCFIPVKGRWSGGPLPRPVACLPRRGHDRRRGDRLRAGHVLACVLGARVRRQHQRPACLGRGVRRRTHG